MQRLPVFEGQDSAKGVNCPPLVMEQDPGVLLRDVGHGAAGVPAGVPGAPSLLHAPPSPIKAECFTSHVLISKYQIKHS